MANTTNLDLVKPLGTDHALVAQINSNSDKIDAEAGRTRANFAAEYSASSAYAVGAFCTHNGILYQCNTAIGSGGEAWTSGHWTQISAGDAIVTNSQAIATLDSKLAYDWNSFTNYVSSLETGANGIITRFGRMRSISFQGAARTHTEDEVLATLPEADRPTAVAIFTSGNIGSTSVVIRINTNGEITLYTLNGATGSARVYFGVTYAV